MDNLPYKPAPKKPHASAFSLVELLVVIAIISVMLVAGVQVFSNSSNSARQASREIIKAHLQQARAHAIATGVPTAIAIPTLGSSNDFGARSLLLFEVEYDEKYKPLKDSAGNERLLQRTEVLPGNFHFVSGSAISSANPTVVDLPLTEVMETSYKGRNQECHIIVFAASGQIVYPGSPVNIAIAQAAKRGNSLTLTERNGNEPVFELFQVNRLTARTRFIEP
jgi:prepilin-type N-terminal cleavage/methylation domain-containing protein